MFKLLPSFTLLGGNDKKLVLENATHPCPRCKRADTVQLTRSETSLIIFNKKIELPSSMRVRYECSKCRWKNCTLPDDDPSFKIIPHNTLEEDLYLNNQSRSESIGYYSVDSSISVYSSSPEYKKPRVLLY